MNDQTRKPRIHSSRAKPCTADAKQTRRQFIGTTSVATAAFTIVPRHVLGGPGFVAPSEKITVAHIGCGTQGLRELPGLLSLPEIQVVAVCDPVKDSNGYVDWSRDGLRSELAQAMGNPDWRRGKPGIHAGRDVAKELIETIYAKERRKDRHRSVTAYADFRELLDKEKDVNAVKIMTPDHLHATISVAAMRKGKHVLMHKPLANRLLEARLVIDTAKNTRVATHFLPASDGANVRLMKTWVDDGAIGAIREIHNWSNRPVWPQYASLPTDKPAVPEGFDWDLWLGPSLDRPYHPHYTHAVFRGWYEFGGGALADMGHYSLWPVFQQFDLDSPVWVESRPSHACALNDNVSGRIRNDYSFPAACTIRFSFAARGNRPAIDLFWYDGSMKPKTPEEFGEERELEQEGMMFVGDKAKIIAGFRGEQPYVLGPSGEVRREKEQPNTDPRRQRSQGTGSWVETVKGGKPTYGDFSLAGPISDAFNLAAVSLRLGGKRLLFDSPNARIKNVPEANKYLTREYRKGWELA